MPTVSAKVVLVAACALVDADGRVLIAQRPAGRSMAGLWEFPGGKVEAGETPEASLIRELKEDFLRWLTGQVLPSRPAVADYDRLVRTWCEEVVATRRHRTTGDRSSAG